MGFMTTAGKHKIFLGIIVLNVVLGSLIASDFGQSWDEYINYTYGEQYLEAYGNPSVLDERSKDYYHGPFYFMVFSATTKLFSAIVGPWSDPDGRHFSNFLAFQMGLIALYFISLRLMGKKAATISTALFAFQPLLFGHAFINQKDIPFMALFITSIWLGISAVESMHHQKSLKVSTAESPRNLQGFVRSLGTEWEQARINKRIYFLVSFLVLLLTLYFLFLSTSFERYSIQILERAYSQTSNPFLNSLFRVIAQDAYKTPLDLYVDKLESAIFWGRIPVLLLVFSNLIISIKQAFPNSYEQFVRFRLQTTALFVAAAIMLGFTCSTRLPGIFAGMLISLFAFLRLREKAIGPIVGYGFIAVISLYATWPAIWNDPFPSLLTRAAETPNFATHPVLFEGMTYKSTSLPRYYLPLLMAYQFSEPMLLLLIPGLIFIGKLIHHDRHSRFLVTIVLLWFAIPFFAQIAFAGGIHSNFRHLLFITPPLAMISGLGIQLAASHIKNIALEAILVILLFIPSLLAIASLHPYEYIYYNTLVTAVPGKVQKFENDYWCTSYKEAMGFVNDDAPSGSIVVAYGPVEAADAFAREDLIVIDEHEDPDYYLGCHRGMDGQPDMQVVEEIKRRGVLLGVVRKSVK